VSDFIKGHLSEKVIHTMVARNGMLLATVFLVPILSSHCRSSFRSGAETFTDRSDEVGISLLVHLPSVQQHHAPSNYYRAIQLPQ
jgi:hypothetical protein